MLFFFRKLLLLFVYPFTFVLLFIGVGTFFLFKGKERKARTWIMLGFTTLFLLSLPPVAMLFIRPLESRYPFSSYDLIPKSDVIVILGGSVSRLGTRPHVEEVDGSRLIPAVRLFHLKKAPLIMVSGGNPYSDPSGTIRTEADDMAEVLLGLGVPDSQILRERQSRTTEENAHYGLKLLEQRGVKSFILVTSAFHMPRSALLFNDPRFSISHVPTSHLSYYGPIALYEYLPSTKALNLSSLAAKEYVGYFLAWLSKSGS